MVRPVSSPDQLDKLRKLAESLDCILDEDLQLLGDLKSSTTESWRKRGQGPEYILLGNRPLYPRDAVAKFLHGRVRKRAEVPVGDLL